MSENLARDATADEAVRTALAANLGTGAGLDRKSPRLLDILAPWRLQVAGYTLAAVYTAGFFYMYEAGDWLFDSAGRPIFNDFTETWIVVRHALYGDAASLHDSVNFADVAAAVAAGANKWNLSYVKWPWPYPPIFSLILAPFVVMPYLTAFFGFQAITLSTCVSVVYLIVRRPAAIALALASPFGVHEVTWGQSGFLRASLVGAALLALERQPVLAGAFIGCLTYAPQFGIMFPVALLAARQWRAFASAAITVTVLVGVSVVAFGISPWPAFARALVTTADDTLFHGNPDAPSIPWAAVQTVYGFFRTLHGSAVLAWVAQGCVTAGITIIVWLVWRSSVRYALKAALLSAATLVATPYAWTHDLTVIVIPIAFLAADQIRCGLFRGEQTILIVLFGIAVSVLNRDELLPLGPVIMISLVGVILRRMLRDGGAPEPAVAA